MTQDPPPILSADLLELDTIEVAPVRPAGFVTLLLGLISVVMLVSTAWLPLPVLVLALGAWTLRPSGGLRPVGTRPAMLGMMLAVFFSIWGIVRENVGQQALVGSAETFAEHWLELAKMGEWEICRELMQPPSARQSPKMPLKDYYASSGRAAEQFVEFKRQPAVKQIESGGDAIEWQVAEPPLVLHSSLADTVTFVFEDRNDELQSQIRIQLKRRFDETTQAYQWYVNLFHEA